MIRNCFWDQTARFHTKGTITPDGVPNSEPRSQSTEPSADEAADHEGLLKMNGEAKTTDYSLKGAQWRRLMLNDVERGINDALEGRVKSLEEIRAFMHR
ncbi:hypothetical protein CS8_089570 [Cupriavidus sp. 8B]